MSTPTALLYNSDQGASFSYSDVTFNQVGATFEYTASPTTITVAPPNPTQILSITLGTDVASVANSTFNTCTNTTNIVVYTVNNNFQSAFGSINTVGLQVTFNYVGAVPASACSFKSNLKNLTLTNITSISNNAFQACTGLTSITIPNGVTTIGTAAFASCSSLPIVTIPSTITSVGGSTFQNCSSLTNIVTNAFISNFQSAFTNVNPIGLQVTFDYAGAVPTSACSGKTNLINVTLANITNFGDSAFQGCVGLTNVIIPNSVTSFGNSAFSGCTGFSNFTIPTNVRDTGSGTFSNCTGLTSITIPNTVTAIGGSAFSGCNKIPIVTIPDGVVIINGGTFSACTGLTSVTIPNSVSNIGSTAFQNCINLPSATISSSVTFIGANAFDGCSSIPTVTIPSSVTSTGNFAFRNCTSLTNIVTNALISRFDLAFQGVNPIAGLQITFNYAGVIPDNSCSAKTNLKNVTITSITGINVNAFNGCTGLTSVTISDSVTNIGTSAFQNCSSLLGVTIPNALPTIGTSVFSNCTGLTIVTIPTSITSINNNAFNSCSGLTSITFPTSVTSIGISAFSNCTRIPSVTIPSTLASVGNTAFQNCTSVTNIVANAYISNFSSAFNGVDPIGLQVTFNYVGEVPNSACASKTNLALATLTNITSIVDGAFTGCTSLTSATIPSTVTNIGINAFANCSILTSATIPSSVTNIGLAAFFGCTRIPSVTIPSTVASVGDSAFEDCTSVTNIITNVFISNFQNVFRNINPISGLQVTFDYVGAVPSSACSGKANLKTVTLTNITSINNGAFNGCTGLTSATIPNGVTNLGDGAFQNCTGLTIATIPNGVTNIGSSAFEGCTRIPSVTIPSNVNSTGNSAFRNCSGLTNIVTNAFISNFASVFFAVNTVGLQVTFDYVGIVPLNACLNKTNLKKAILTNITTIFDDAFRNCNGLTSVSIPNSVTNISYRAFDNCSSLPSVYIRDTIEIIDSSAFLNTTSLTSVYISNVEAIRLGFTGSPIANPPGVTSFFSAPQPVAFLLAVPIITDVSPSVGPKIGGTNVTISGSFLDTTNLVTFGGNNATSIVIIDETQILCITPAHAPGPVNVVVTNDGGPSNNFPFTYDITCFKEGAKILTDEGYKPVQDLRKGDLVKTASSGFKKIEYIGHAKMYNNVNNNRSDDKLYRCSASEYPELIEDLIITGGHSILVKKFKDNEQKIKTKDILGYNYVTEKHYRLPACIDDRSKMYEEEGIHTIWHFSLENTDYINNYGVYANGLLVETASNRMMVEFSGLKMLE